MRFHALVFAPLLAVAQAEVVEDWTYAAVAPGLRTPTQWSDTHAICGGQRQSPIDIVAPMLKGVAVQAPPLTFAGTCPQFNVTQHYDAYKAEVIGGSCTVALQNETFAFAQAHFHAPSEHKINGRVMDGEAHFVHKGSSGRLLVVGMFLESTGCGETEGFAAKLVDALDDAKEHHPVTASLGSFHTLLQAGIKAGRTFNYAGSLTTPNCDEIVDWWVIEKPVKVTADEMAKLRREMKRIAAADNGRNARPTQPLHGRQISIY